MSRSTVIARIDGEGHNVMEVVVSYRKGGINYATYKRNPRGYYLAVRPVEIKDGVKTYVLLSGMEKQIEETARYSEKRLRQLAVDIFTDPVVGELYDAVAADHAEKGFPETWKEVVSIETTGNRESA